MSLHLPSLLSRLPLLPRALLPGACALCGGECGDTLCAGCESQFFRDDRRRCHGCALPLPADASAATRCGDCLRRPPAFDAAVAAVDYVPPLEQLVLGLKFGHRLALAPMLAQRMAGAWRASAASTHDGPALMTVVPLGPARLAERGFNQAAEIARPLATLLRLPLDPRLLQRQRDTTPQALLHPDERRRNVRQAFRVDPARLRGLTGSHVVIVDDVMTTGETINAAAAALKRRGAARVTALVFARTVN